MIRPNPIWWVVYVYLLGFVAVFAWDLFPRTKAPPRKRTQRR